jgi:malonate transporter MadL subunit
MIIYGVSILAFCTLSGIYLGDLIGIMIGVKSNVGGVGIAMLLLITLAHFPKKIFHIDEISQKGVIFWSAMYIPIIVAMAAKQNAVAALAAGPVALTAGILAVAFSFAMIPVLMRFSKSEDHKK